MTQTTKKETPLTLDVFTAGLWKENPVFVMMLGLCPVLAVTNSVLNSLAMGIASIFVLVCSNALVSALRNFIPKQVRITTYIIIIATFVTLVDYIIQAVSLDLYNKLGAFIQLIVVNCLILGRAEAYASKNSFTKSVVSAFGMGLGFTLALVMLGGVRELLGAGQLLGYQIFSTNFEPWVVMILPPGGFIVLGSWLLLINYLEQRKTGKLISQDEASHCAVQGTPS
ncbi:electron transport complex protein RnfE [Bathymodiolus platifrons methanotrophic gill symbiont]|uniref:electron transport complex subunit RsxE n=1 Tax=Bathymodiolus platifrons methanotrophic gill symbiont TaxID=113268 RepID=UPI000B409E52|nr:electron transport complex subunit E [Bathymodiolus platifrons methanotrophic gill symbiont]TXK96546.1 electron transport complex subunit RsxE [Methylococcaceae bacterium CS4]TXK98930.1 electron transport complex subunit RsxE [Methylococcaceae bacterium CS5]TXL06829.1 electron transport complex subunit RsxE [Methylococcaceae bacterium CS3]TXL07579.1 electron transport complex subunit RsxE [Methylococcaceae bacterium CS1]TXL11420.1 electron transport complex subunit RsxE [Methylococcaceae ba